MKKTVHEVSSWLLLIVFLSMAVYVTYTRYANIDMTETRLFVTYWKQYAMFFVPAILLSAVHAFTKE